MIYLPQLPPSVFEDGMYRPDNLTCHMTSKNYSNKIANVTFSSKANAFILKCADGQSIIVGEALLASMSKAQGVSPKGMLRCLIGSKVSCTINHVLVGEPVMNGTTPLVRDGVQVTYTTEHDRFANIAIALTANPMLDSLDKAEAYGEALAKIYGKLTPENKPLEEPTPETAKVQDNVPANADLVPLLDENATN